MSPRSSVPTLRVERAMLRDGIRLLASVDEVGRGALAGPVTVGVVVSWQSLLLTKCQQPTSAIRPPGRLRRHHFPRIHACPRQPTIGRGIGPDPLPESGGAQGRQVPPIGHIDTRPALRG